MCRPILCHVTPVGIAKPCCLRPVMQESKSPKFMDNFAVIHARRTGNFSVAHFLKYRLSKARIAGELLLLSVKKRIPLFVNKKQREVIGHLVRLRNSPVTGSHKLDGRLFGYVFLYTPSNHWRRPNSPRLFSVWQFRREGSGRHNRFNQGGEDHV